MKTRQSVQITYLWQGQVIAYRLLPRRHSVSIGDHRRVTFATPRLAGFPAKFRLLRPVKDGVSLRLGPGMSGTLELRGQRRTVGDLLLTPAVRRFLRDPGMFREVELYPGDSATIDLDVAKPGNLQLLVSFADAPEPLAKPRILPEPFFVRTVLATSLALLAFVFVARFLSDRFYDESLALTDEKVRKVVMPQLEEPKPKVEEKKVAEAARKKKEKEAAMSKRAKDQEGKLGRNDAPNRPTVLPKGREDLLRAKVAKTGILAALGTQRAPGSGLGRLFDTTSTADLEQAMNGLAGATLVAGKGAGGLGNQGSGLGGGGVGLGRVQGSGSLDLGPGRGRGRKGAGPGLSKGREREVQVGIDGGNANTDGGLTRDQVTRVVKDHASAIKYCYEKELQRQPTLSGKIEVYWVIRPNGSVDRVRIASTTVGSREVEGCIERQVRNWQFPRSDADTIVQTFPFFFKGQGG
jgi:outer membrane biosynthesis protein TonB